jgi:RNA polymerase sigma-70 factor (ECF subfamily)
MDDPPEKITPEILDAVRAGDDAASREFVDMLFPLVISIVRNHLPHSEAEEDLCQDIFLKVFARFDQYSGRQPVEHWVSRIALNTCYDRLRRQKTRRVASFAELDADEAVLLGRFAGNGPERPLEGGRRLAAELLDKLLAALNPRERMVVRMLDLEELSVAEVCELTGWQASRVRVTAMRARRKLNQTLERLEQGARQPS